MQGGKLGVRWGGMDADSPLVELRKGHDWAFARRDRIQL